MKRIIQFCILLFAFCICLTACGHKCEHAYDNECDATCNKCGEVREGSAHQWNTADCLAPKTCKICGVTEGEPLGHNWQAADCVTAKTCKTCGATEGEPLGHTPNAPDGDCGTALLCAACHAVVREAGVHLPDRDDGNCKTEVRCTECNGVTTAAKAGHTDADGDFLCDDKNCAVTLPGAPEDNSPGFDLPIDPN